MIPMHHPDIPDAEIEAVSEDQAAHLETLGWERTPPAKDDAPTEVHTELVVGTTSSLGDELVIVEADDHNPQDDEPVVDDNEDSDTTVLDDTTPGD